MKNFVIHTYKILKVHHDRVKAGTKRFEIRERLGRNPQKGDMIILKTWDPEISQFIEQDYTEWECGDVYAIDETFDVFGLVPFGGRD